MQIIEKINLLDQIENKLQFIAPEASFSVFSPQNNYLNIQEIRGLYRSNQSRPVSDYIMFKPSRILEHEIIINLTLKVKLNNLKEDLQQKFNFLKDSINLENYNLNQVIFSADYLKLGIEQIVIAAIDHQIATGML